MSSSLRKASSDSYSESPKNLIGKIMAKAKKDAASAAGEPLGAGEIAASEDISDTLAHADGVPVASHEIEAMQTDAPPVAHSAEADAGVGPGTGAAAFSELGQQIDEMQQVVATAVSDLDLPAVATPTSRRRKTYAPLSPLERQQLAAKRTKKAEDFLARKIVGAAFVKRNVTINHSHLASLFKLSFPMCDRVFVQAYRTGDFILGERETAVFIDMAEKMTHELKALAEQNFKTAVAFSEASALAMTAGLDNLDPTTLQYNSAFEQPVGAQSPLSNQLLGCFDIMDKAMIELDKLHWSGLRTYKEIDEEFRRFKSAVTKIVQLARRASYAIADKYRERFNPAATNEAVFDALA